MQYAHCDDTIVAISTPLGQGGIGIVRLSGSKALAIADQVFVSQNSKLPSTFKSHSVHYGKVVSRDQGKTQVIDEALLLVMRSPRTYTCEDVVEIHGHGGMVSLKKILSLTLTVGARLAEPGEFTKRAFLNGRIDLTQAEAVADIINARTESFLDVSVHQLRGELRFEIESIREHLMSAYVDIEARLNFPDDDTSQASCDLIKQKTAQGLGRVEQLLLSSKKGQILREGVKVVICGKPNVGKSSLLNVFLKQSRAIVSPIEGTTRDTIEEMVQIEDVLLHLVDTAGILEPRDSIEEEAVRRSHVHIDQAEIILMLFDVSQKLTLEDKRLMEKIQSKKIIAVLNKSDCPSAMSQQDVESFLPSVPCVKISALHREGIKQLETMILNIIGLAETDQSCSMIVSNLRHQEALRQCLSSLHLACEHLDHGLSLEFVSEDMKLAIRYLDQITGYDIDADLLDKIFSTFCIGK